MLLTHRITDNTGTFSVRFVRTVIQFDHTVENTSLHRLQPVSYIRQRSGSDHTHGVVDVRFFHCPFQVHFLNLIKNIVFQNLCPPALTRIPALVRGEFVVSHKLRLRLHIKIAYTIRIRLNKLSSWLYLITHQRSKSDIDR